MSHVYVASNSVTDAHSSVIFSVASTETFTITASGDGTVSLWDNMKEQPDPIVALQSLVGFHHIATNGRNLLAAVSYDGRIHLFDLIDLKPLETPAFAAEESKYWAISLSLEKDLLVASTIDGAVDVWDIKSLEEPQKIGILRGLKKGFGLSVDISPDGAFIATGQETGTLWVYKVETQKLFLAIPGHSSPIRAVKFSPSSNMIAVAGDSKLISLYTVATGEHVTNLSGHEGWIFSLAWSETGEFLLSSCYDGKAKIWSLETMACVFTITENEKPLLNATWLDKGWGKGVIGGKNKGVVTVGEERAVRWYREAAGQ